MKQRWNTAPPTLPIRWIQLGGHRYMIDAQDRLAFKPETRLYCSIHQAERLLADALQFTTDDVLFRRSANMLIRDLTAVLDEHRRIAA